MKRSSTFVLLLVLVTICHGQPITLTKEQIPLCKSLDGLRSLAQQLKVCGVRRTSDLFESPSQTPAAFVVCLKNSRSCINMHFTVWCIAGPVLRPTSGWHLLSAYAGAWASCRCRRRSPAVCVGRPTAAHGTVLAHYRCVCVWHSSCAWSTLCVAAMRGWPVCAHATLTCLPVVGDFRR